MTSTVIESLGGALLGGFVTGCFTLLGVKKAHRNDIRLEEKKQKAVVDAFLHALRDEIKTVWEVYQVQVGIVIESLQNDDALWFYYPLTQEYFMVYSSNNHLIGHVKDAEMRRLIVEFYIKAKGLVDSFKMNNHMIKEHAQWTHYYNLTHNPCFQQKADDKLSTMKDYAKKLAASHCELRELADELIKRLVSYRTTAEEGCPMTGHPP